MKTTALLLATRNAGKLAEFPRLLADLPLRLVGLDEVGVTEDLVEPASTYQENAVAKAQQAARLAGLPALADDSGIEVLALDGWPGPLSARWLGPDASGRDRLEALLTEVGRRCPDDRRACYVAVVALARPDGGVVSAQGRCSGVLVAPDGSAGFGYDPAFLSDDLGITFGNATAEQKDQVSHRARALIALRKSGGLP